MSDTMHEAHQREVAELERAFDRTHEAYQRELAAVEREFDRMLGERNRARARAKQAAQTLIAEIGSVGPEGVDKAAERAAAELRRLREELKAVDAFDAALDGAAMCCKHGSQCDGSCGYTRRRREAVR